MTQASLQGLLSTSSPVLCIDTDWDDIVREDAGDLESEGSQDALAYVIYTSGSTGLPKGVPIPHRAVVNFLCAMQRQHRLAETDALLAVTTLSFDIAGLELYLPLMAGGRVVLASREVAMDGARLIEALDHSGASIMQATPTTWQLLIEAGWRGNKNLKVLCGGEPLPRELAKQLLERCSSLWNMYGPTETTIWSTAHLMSASDATVSIGRPIDNTHIYILDAARQLVPIGAPGELHIGGSGLARGYLNRPELTAQKFIPDPFALAPGARLYKTGDLARYLVDGTIELLGRLDHQVKIRGFRIELGEIETVLTQCPGLMQAVVVARDDPSGRKALVAYVTTRQGSVVSVAEMTRHVKSKLPDYMVPSAFVRLDELPLTPNGKIDRAALPSPGLTRLSLEHSLVPPRDHLERQVANIWERILGVHAIGVKDNFFELGGYSLLAVRVMSQIEAVLGAKLPVTALFQMPTVEQLARLLREDVSYVPWSSLAPLQPKGSNAPFFWVHGEASDAVLPRHFGADQPLYGLLHQAHDGRRARYTTVEAIAAHYLSEIRTVQAHGPYVIGGFCFGAVVAFEIAQQLERDNEHVALLALVDPSRLRNVMPPDRMALNGGHRSGSRCSPAGTLSLQVRQRSGHDHGVHPIVRIARNVRDIVRSTRGAVRKQRQALAARAYLQLGLLLPDSLRSQYILDIYFKALDRYRPIAYSGPVIMFRANPTWTSILTGPVASHEVPGSHTDILEPAQVSVWAEILKPVLAAAQAATDPVRGMTAEVPRTTVARVVASSRLDAKNPRDERHAGSAS